MTELKPGDIVRITKGEPDEPGYKCEVRTVAEGFPAHPGVNQYGLRTFEHEGWTVELVERPLPTTPNSLGWATVGGVRRLARYRSDGEWELYSDQGWYKGYALARDLGDFTEAVLIPKELADRVTAWVYGDSQEVLSSLIVEIADHLKGDDDE